MRLAPLVLFSAVLAGCASAPTAPPVVAPVAVAPPPVAPEPVALPAPEPVAAAPLAPAAAPFDLAAIGRKNIGQPYVLNLLGEYPYELHDNLPMFSLQASDCVVFAEHTYAMALSQSWEEFFWMLQRIRYKDGVIGVATRNHYTEVDWNTNNAWLVSDVSALLAGSDAPAYEMKIDRAAFLRMRHNTASSIPVQLSQEAYVAKDKVASVAAQLQDLEPAQLARDPFASLARGVGAKQGWRTVLVSGDEGEILMRSVDIPGQPVGLVEPESMARVLASGAPTIGPAKFAQFGEQHFGKAAVEPPGTRFGQRVGRAQRQRRDGFLGTRFGE